MTITFACSCGRQLAAADENAGQRVRCGACGGIQTVPTAAPAPRWLAEEATMIRFACTDCGQTCQAQPEHAGKNTRCPQCNRILTIPGSSRNAGDLEDVAARPADALQADRPLPRRLGRSRYDEDDRDEEDDRPRRRLSVRKKSRTWLWLSLTAALLVLCGGGLALWLLLRTTTSGDFDLVPRDAQGFITYRVADVLKTPLGKKTMEKVQPELLAPLKDLESKTGLTLKDIDRVTAVFVDVEQMVFWVIVQTSRPVDRDKILRLADNPPEKTHGGKKYYAKRDLAIAFLHSRLLVFGTEKGIERCLDLPKKPKKGPLDDALRAASKSKVQFAAGAYLAPDLMGRLKSSLEQLPGDAKKYVNMFAPLFDIRTAYITSAIGEDTESELVLSFPDSAKAKKGEETLNQVLSTVRFFLPFAKLGLKNQGIADKGAEEMITQIQKSLEQLKPKQSGNTVSMAWKDSGNATLKFLDGMNQPFGQKPRRGGGFGQFPGR